MAGSLSRADLIASLKESLHEAADPFKLDDPADDSQFSRLIDVAAEDFGRVVPRTLLGCLNLVAGQPDYPAPADFSRMKSPLWGVNHGIKPWEPRYPGRLPSYDVSGGYGAYTITLNPAPTERQISALGSNYRFYYAAAHQVGSDAADTTIPAALRGLFLLRCQAEAMRELALRNVAIPVTLRDGFSGQPRNGTPSHIYAQLMGEFDARGAA